MTTSVYSAKSIVGKLRAGPHKYERIHKRIRGLLGGKWIFDTTEAYHVWEHPWYPLFYVPVASFAVELQINASPDGEEQFALEAQISVGLKTASHILVIQQGPLRGMVRVEPDDIDEWFEEDQAVYGHPKNPYKRIDILPSSRHIKVMIEGTTVAESSSSQFLFETSLRARYYLPKTCVNWQYFRESETVTMCPYKGRANYYHFDAGHGELRDVLWWYQYPTAESAAIAGLVSFYNEKVDIYIDGQKEEMPSQRRDSHGK